MDIFESLREMFYSYIHHTAYKIISFFIDKKEINREPLIIDNEDVKILSVFTTSKSDTLSKSDIDNIQKYIKNNIEYTDDVFEKCSYDSAIVINFKFKNESYSLYVDKMESTKDDHSDINHKPRFLAANVHKEEEKIDVTGKMKEIHGHSRNFYEHIPDALHKDKVIKMHLEDHLGENDNLRIFDSMGNEHTYEF